jgi:hypothetical protein
MHILMVERLGLGLLFAVVLFVALMSKLRSQRGEGVVINVPGGQREVEPGG